MQIIYAAPFILLSMIAFGVFLVVPRLRRHSISALVAPVAFGFCALAGYISWVLICGFVLKIALRPVEGVHGFFEVLFFFLLPGFAGAWLAIWLSETMLRKWGNKPVWKR